MNENDFDEFCALIDAAYEIHNKAVTEKAKALFFVALRRYPLNAIRKALSAHMVDPASGKFPPVPAHLVAQIDDATGGDGRPGPEEAWAIAILSQDEADTVVWTDEAAEAFAICQPVLRMGDEVGARMAFKESYLRIVARARSERRPVHWFPSLGWDTTKRTAALTAAVTGGLLPASSVAGLLPAPGGVPVTDDNARMQLDMIKKMMAESIAAKQREFEECDQRQRDATTTAKARANALAASYGHSEAA